MKIREISDILKYGLSENISHLINIIDMVIPHNLVHISFTKLPFFLGSYPSAIQSRSQNFTSPTTQSSSWVFSLFLIHNFCTNCSWIMVSWTGSIKSHLQPLGLPLVFFLPFFLDYPSAIIQLQNINLTTVMVPLENNFQWEYFGIFWNILEYFGIFQNTPGYYGIFQIIVIPLYSRMLQNILKYSKIFQNTQKYLGIFWEYSGIFNILGIFWNIWEYSGIFWNILEYSGIFGKLFLSGILH